MRFEIRKATPRFHDSRIVGLALFESLPVLAQTRVPAAGVTAPGFEAMPILSNPIRGDKGREVVLVTATIQAVSASPPHRHPGECVGMVIEGQIELRARGKGVHRVAASEAFANAGGSARQFVNVDDKPATLAPTLLVGKCKPRTLTQPELK